MKSRFDLRADKFKGGCNALVLPAVALERGVVRPAPGNSVFPSLGCVSFFMLVIMMMVMRHNKLGVRPGQQNLQLRHWPLQTLVDVLGGKAQM